MISYTLWLIIEDQPRVGWKRWVAVGNMGQSIGDGIKSLTIVQSSTSPVEHFQKVEAHIHPWPLNPKPLLWVRYNQRNQRRGISQQGGNVDLTGSIGTNEEASRAAPELQRELANERRLGPIRKLQVRDFDNILLCATHNSLLALKSRDVILQLHESNCCDFHCTMSNTSGGVRTQDLGSPNADN